MWGLYQQTVVAHMGSQVNVLIFIVIIIGGLGSTGGALIGALLVGLMANYTGFLVPKVEREKLMACTFVGTKFLHRVPEGKLVLRCFFGGAGNEAVLADSDEGLVATAGRELNRIIGLKAKPVYTMVSRWSKA